jgi:hypothetical protein
VLELEPYCGLPSVPSVHPWLGAADPLGFTQETCIHSPARADCAASARPTSASANAARPSRAVLLVAIAYLLNRARV